MNDVPAPPGISFGDDADVSDDYYEYCSYDGDSATLTCACSVWSVKPIWTILWITRIVGASRSRRSLCLKFDVNVDRRI